MMFFFLPGFQTEPGFAQNQQIEGTRKVATRVVPTYPLTARNMNLVGTVKLEALVLANGRVKSVQVKGGNPLLVQSAESAVREWKWEKGEHDTTELVEFNFRP
jgi:TonB family C-terminal domain